VSVERWLDTELVDRLPDHFRWSALKIACHTFRDMRFRFRCWGDH